MRTPSRLLPAKQSFEACKLCVAVPHCPLRLYFCVIGEPGAGGHCTCICRSACILQLHACDRWLPMRLHAFAWCICVPAAVVSHHYMPSLTGAGSMNCSGASLPGDGSNSRTADFLQHHPFWCETVCKPVVPSNYAVAGLHNTTCCNGTSFPVALPRIPVCQPELPCTI